MASELEQIKAELRKLQKAVRRVEDLKDEVHAVAAPIECMLERLEVIEAFLGETYREYEAAHRAEIVNG